MSEQITSVDTCIGTLYVGTKLKRRNGEEVTIDYFSKLDNKGQSVEMYFTELKGRAHVWRWGPCNNREGCNVDYLCTSKRTSPSDFVAIIGGSGVSSYMPERASGDNTLLLL